MAKVKFSSNYNSFKYNYVKTTFNLKGMFFEYVFNVL